MSFSDHRRAIHRGSCLTCDEGIHTLEIEVQKERSIAEQATRARRTLESEKAALERILEGDRALAAEAIAALEARAESFLKTGSDLADFWQRKAERAEADLARKWDATQSPLYLGMRDRAELADKKLEDFIRTFAIQPSAQALAEKLHKAEADLAAVSQESLAWQAHLVQFHSCAHVVAVERAAGRESGSGIAAGPPSRGGKTLPGEPVLTGAAAKPAARQSPP